MKTYGIVKEDSDSDNQQEETDEDLIQRQEEFYRNLENKLIEMEVTIIQKNEVEKFRPEIGQGSFGKVYRGNYLGKQVAIKKILLNDNNFDDEEQTKRALYDITNEIKTVKYVVNSKIPKLYGLWKNRGNFNLIFEFCQGKNLKEAYPKLNEMQKLDICLQLSDTLIAIHGSNLMHRDIKPANIMIDDNLNIKLIDFGVSRIANRTSTFTADVSGTTRYMAPEFYDIGVNDNDIDKPIKIDTKVDIWSTGCLISEIFSGIIPWWNIVRNEMILRRKLMEKANFPIPDEIQNNDIKEIIQKCVKNCPDERISAKELSFLIKKIMNRFD